MDRTLLATVRFAKQWILSAALGGCLSSPLLGVPTPSTPPPKKRAPEPLSQPSTAAPAPQAPARLVFADPYPSPPTPPEPDLLLTEKSQARVDALHWFAMGTLLETEGAEHLAASQEYLQKALARDPGNTSLAVRLAQRFLQQQLPSEALRLLKDAQQVVPNDASLLTEIARIYLFSLRQPDNALAYAEKAYRLSPDALPTITILVEVCSTAKLTQRLDDVLKKTETLQNPKPQFWISVGDLFRNAYTLRSSGMPKPPLERIGAFFQKAMGLAPGDAKCVEKTADHFVLTRQLKEACALYERANQLFREKNKLRSPEITLKWARALAIDEQVDTALELLEEFIQEQPLLPAPREMAGELYLRQGQFVAALGHFRIALDTDPSELNDHVRLLQLQLRLKRAEEAVQSAQKARQLFPDAPALTLLHAMALSEAKRLHESIPIFEKAEQQFTATDRDALNASFYMTFGAAAERAGFIEKAATLLKKSIALDPANAAEALNYLGYMWIDRNQNLEEAGQLVRQALTLRPNQPAYLDSLAWWHFRRGEFAEAEPLLRKAISTLRREDAAEVYEHLGDVLEKLNRPEEALAAWCSAFEMDPALQSAKSKLERLRLQRPPSAPSPTPNPKP